jgi:hypothetical protein
MSDVFEKADKEDNLRCDGVYGVQSIPEGLNFVVEFLEFISGCVEIVLEGYRFVGPWKCQ